MSTDSANEHLLKEVLDGLKALQKDNAQLASAIDGINGRVNMLAGVKQLHDDAASSSQNGAPTQPKETESTKSVAAVSEQYEGPTAVELPRRRESTSSKTSKIILTSYPGQAGVDPLPMDWGHKDPNMRGPVVVSRHPNTIRRRNGMLSQCPFTCSRLLTHFSHWCPRRLIFHLPCSCRRKQEHRRGSQAGLYQYGARRRYWPLSAME